MNTFLLIGIVVVVLTFLLFRNMAGSSVPSITPDEIPQLLEKYPNLQVLDVRTPKETAAGKIKGAREVNFLSANFHQQISALPKDRPYLIYCRSGQRSAGACKIMLKQGFTDVYNLRGGYQRM